ncbi:MAG: TonB-dependent receptor domain-containing protein [Pseudomonadales bacterium]
MSKMQRDGLYLGERDNLPTKTESSFGQPGSYLLLAPSTAIPTAVPGAFNADPACGTATGTRVVPTGGGSSLCFFDFGPSFSLVPDEDRLSAYAILEYDMNDYVTIRAEAGTARNEIQGGFSPSYPVLAFPVIAANHPGNPFGVPVAGRFRAIGDGLGAPGENRVVNFANHDTDRYVISVFGDIGDTGWSYDVAFTDSRNDLTSSAGDQVGQNLTLALAGFGGASCNPFTGTAGVGDCLYYNPFGTALTAAPGSAQANSQEVLDFISTRNIGQTESDLKTFEAVVTGELFDVSAGTVYGAFGYQNREETRKSINSLEANLGDLLFLQGDADSTGRREIDAVFGEINAPIFDNDHGALELSLAVRYEDYDTGFDSTDPKIGLLWRNVDDNLSLRFTYGTSFRAPTLFQQSETATSLNQTSDPLTASVAFLGFTASPNVNLEPEEADTYNIGFTWSPLDELTLSLDYYNVEYNDRLSSEAGQQLINDEAAALLAAGCTPTTLTTPACAALRNPQIIRDPATGTPLRIFVNRFNAVSSETDGLDFEASYFWDTDFGSFSLLNNTTYIASYEIQAVSGGPTIDGAGKRNESNSLARSLPEIRSNTSIGWIRENHSANLVLRYIDEYEESTGSDVDDWWVADLQYNYDTEVFGGPAQFTIGAQNITDEEPPEVAGGTNEFGYDTKVHDPRGRMLYLRLKYSIE